MRSILFFVNSFGKGGAERVCVNLGEEYVKQGYNVCFITLFENSSYIESNTKFNICNLKLDEKMSKLELNKIAARWPAKAVTQFFFS